jgi:hypothetical protein
MIKRRFFGSKSHIRQCGHVLRLNDKQRRLIHFDIHYLEAGLIDEEVEVVR